MFPRTSVWIRHEGSEPFLADPNVVTIYNRAQRYERFPASMDGDRCDWFAVSDDVAREIVGTFDASVAESDRPFRFEWATGTAALYFRQRMLVRRAERGAVNELECDEAVIGIVAAVLALAHRQPPAPLARRARAARRHRELAAAARAELFKAPELNRSVNDLAQALDTSPYHLCRVFRACTGMTMHGYRTGLRVRLALELLEESDRGPSALSSVAHRLGFASHSHFVLASRRHFGATPSAVRRALRA